MYKLAMIIFLFLLSNIAHCVYRQEAYKIFDKFTMTDLFSLYSKQQLTKRCNIIDGPNCSLVSSYSKLSDSEYLKDIIEKVKAKGIHLTFDSVYKTLQTELQIFSNKNRFHQTQTFNITPKIMMNLLMNFESFDQTTRERDIYMPAERTINFTVGSIKINFLGKLRLTADRSNKIDTKKIITPKKDGPNQTYGVVEDKDLTIKFDKPVLIHYIYVRPHHSASDKEENKYKLYDLELTGYLKDKMVFRTTSSLVYQNNQWTKIIPTQTLVDSIRIPKNFEIDDLSISHTSEATETEEGTNDQITNLIKDVIDNLLDQSNKKLLDEEDD